MLELIQPMTGLADISILSLSVYTLNHIYTCMGLTIWLLLLSDSVTQNVHISVCVKSVTGPISNFLLSTGQWY